MVRCNATQTLDYARSLLRSSVTNAYDVRKLRNGLTTLSKIELLALVDILHVGDGLTWRKLQRMNKTTLAQLIVSDCFPSL